MLFAKLILHLQSEFIIENLYMVEDNVAIRLKGFIDSYGLSNSQFADTCGIPRPSLSQLLSGRNKKISDVLVGQIHQAYPELSVLWLLFGEGPMLKDQTAPATSKTGKTGQNGTLPLIDDFEEKNQEDNLNINRGKEENQNVRALTTGHDRHQQPYNKQVEDDVKNIELMKQIDKLRKNPRKVAQITVYYDDSTFETFYPKR